MLLCVAVCCRVLQCVAVCCSEMQGVPVCCSVLQCVAVCCGVLQCLAVSKCCAFSVLYSTSLFLYFTSLFLYFTSLFLYFTSLFLYCILHFLFSLSLSHTCILQGGRRLIGSPKLHIIFHKRAIKYRLLLRKMTSKDKGSYESAPPCTASRKSNSTMCSLRV